MGGKKGSSEVKETEAERVAAEVAVKQWQLYKNELKGFEDNFIQRVDNVNSSTNMAEAKEAVDLGYNKNYSDARTQTADSMAASGIDPSSGKFQGTLNDMTTEQSIKQGDTVNRAQVGEQDKHVAGLQDVVAIGMGQKAESLSGINDTASLSLRKATADAYDDFNRSAATVQTIGAVAGAGLRASTQPAPKNVDTFQQMQSGSKDGFSPIGGASSFGLKH